MKLITDKLLKFLKNNKIVILIIILLVAIYYQYQRIEYWKKQYHDENNINISLNDSIKYFKNERNEWVAEKQTIQTSLKQMEQMNNKLNNFQKELLSRIKEIEKKNTIIAAALIQTNVKIDSLLDKDIGGQITIDTLNKKINFTNSDTIFNYNIDVNNVIPSNPNKTPSIFFNSIELPNKQFINFYWKNDRKKGYPVAFSISNSNPYFKTVNIDSYIIPNIDKKHLNPNFWQKIDNFFFKNKDIVIYFSVGAVTGIGIASLFLK